MCSKRYFLNICKISYFVQYLLFVFLVFEVPEDRHQSRECLTLSYAARHVILHQERQTFRSEPFSARGHSCAQGLRARLPLILLHPSSFHPRHGDAHPPGVAAISVSGSSGAVGRDPLCTFRHCYRRPYVLEGGALTAIRWMHL